MGWVESLPSGNHRGVARNAITGRRWSKTFIRWSDADAWWKQEERDEDSSYTTAGIDVARQRRGIPSFAEHVTGWAQLGVLDAELSTRCGYQGHARALAARWSTERVDEITEIMVRGYLAELRDDGKGTGTRTVRLTVLRHAMRAAIKAGYRPDDPTLGIKGPKPHEHQPRILTDEELMLLLAALPGWLWPAALLSHDAGLRISEICGLRMCNLNLLHSKVTVIDIIDVDGRLRRYPKSKTIRNVPLSPRVVAALDHHVRDQAVAGKLAPVFANPRTGQHLRPTRIRDEWDRALKLAAIDGEKPTWHDLRHGCATILAEAGANPFEIMEILGHRNIETTMGYVRHAGAGRLAAVVNHAFGPSDSQANLG